MIEIAVHIFSFLGVLFQVVPGFASPLDLGIGFDGSIPELSSQALQGSVSHIVSAALQTKGLIDQGKVLQKITSLNELAGFFYLVSICLAIASVAIFGSYRQGLYLLIGPALYTFMVTTTTTTNGVTARLGLYEAPNSIAKQSAFLKHIKAIGEEDGGPANISLFFATFDAIVSETIQQLNGLLLDTNNREHLRIAGRERALAYILMSQPTGGVLPRMVARHHAECASMVRDYAVSGKDSKGTVNINLRDKADAALPKAHGDLSWKQTRIVLGNPDLEIKRFLKAMPAVEGIQSRVEVKDELDDVPVSCEQLWGSIMSAIKLMSTKALEDDYYKGVEDSGEDDQERSEAVADVRSALEEGVGAEAEDVVGAFMYKQVLTQSSLSGLESQIYGSSPFNAKLYRSNYQDIPGAEARGAYFGLRYFAMSIPYIQGLILYMLAVGFPFFAVLLVIPGKATSFLMWCSLWVWAKSWDLGFALVLVARDMFWHMLKFRNNSFDNALDLNDPSSVFGIILNNDPLATMNTYWEISYALTVAVPFLTAHFCLGATNVFGMFRGSIDETAARFKLFETQSGRRSIANDIELSRRHEQAKIQAGFASHVLSMESKDMSPNPLDGGRPLAPMGAQTMFGDSIAFDRKEEVFNIENSMRLSGARQGQAMVAFDFAGAMTQLGTAEFSQELAGMESKRQNLEDKVNTGLPAGAEKYAIPSEFGGISKLGEKAPSSVIERIAGENSAIKAGREYTWSQLLEDDAKSKGQELAIPSVMRGLPSLNAPVDAATLKEMFEDSNHPLRKRADSGATGAEGVTWKDVFAAAHEDQRSHFNYLAATVGRRYMVQTQIAADSLIDATTQAQAIGLLSRSGVSGVDQKGFANAFSSYGAETAFEAFSSTFYGIKDSVQVDRPGVGPMGEAAGKSTVPIETK